MQENQLSEVVEKILSSKTLIFDYDGVLAPINVARSKSMVFDEITEPLKLLSRKFKLVVASTKDYSFLINRVDFAHILICSNGFEVRIGVLPTIPKMPSNEKLQLFYQLIAEAKELAESHGMDVEVKKIVVEPLNIPVGLCIDWRRSTLSRDDAVRLIEPVINAAEKGGLNVVRYPEQPFIDIFIDKIDKGWAIKALLSINAISRPITYFGDSENDIPAFKVSDINVLIRHEENRNLIINGTYELTREEFFNLINIISGMKKNTIN